MVHVGNLWRRGGVNSSGKAHVAGAFQIQQSMGFGSAHLVRQLAGQADGNRRQAATLDCPRTEHHATASISGCSRAISSRRSAAPEGCLRPFSQLIAVTTGTLSMAAKTGWLTFSRARMRATSCGVTVGAGSAGCAQRGKSCSQSATERQMIRSEAALEHPAMNVLLSPP